MSTPHSPAPGRKEKDLDATKSSKLDVAIKVVVLATAAVKLTEAIFTWAV